MLFPVVLLASFALIQQTPPTGPTPAPTPAPVETAAATPPAASPSRTTQVCRMEPVTGSRFGRRVCRSAVQTAEEAAESREMLRQLQGTRMPDM